ncbi:MAG TPA: hypothetical protein PKH23_01395 [Bacillota bacterium]|nr:hypothetical protein [Bacillota bacterium]
MDLRLERVSAMEIRPIEYYKPTVASTVARQRDTWEAARRREGGHVTFRALLPSDVSMYDEIDLTSFNFEDDIDAYCDLWAELLFRSMNARIGVEDNYIPYLSPMLGIGDYSAFVAGDIVFQRDTSWSAPQLANVGDYVNLPPLGTSVWYGKLLAICENLIRMCARGGFPFLRGFFSPCDLAASLRGDQIYYDFYDDPDGLRGLLDYCADAIIYLAKDIYALCDQYLSGTAFGRLYTSGVINMSEDISCMISGRLYREFCAPATQKVINAFGSGHMHSHSRAMYLVREICALDHVTHLWLATDPNQPRPIEHLGELVRDARGTCLAIDCESFGEIEQNRELLKRGNFSICLPVKDRHEAMELNERFEALFYSDG